MLIKNLSLDVEKLNFEGQKLAQKDEYGQRKATKPRRSSRSYGRSNISRTKGAKMATKIE